MKIIISNKSSTPIYEQIKDQVIGLISDEVLKEDDQLPSIRQLAKDLKISVITTTRAYNELESEGYIIGVAGKGYYVLKRSKQLSYESMMVDLESHLIEVMKLKNQMELSNEELENIIKILNEEVNHE